MSAEKSPLASQLCLSCGLCCNGVIFHTVRLQPGDSPKTLAALGLKLKRKNGRQLIQQPCPAFQEMRCAIYGDRPERCRLFACRQIRAVAAGEITEAQALERIHEVQRRVDELHEWLSEAGRSDCKKPLSRRCEKALAEPLEASENKEIWSLRKKIEIASQELETLLDTHFRLAPELSAAPEFPTPPSTAAFPYA